MTPNDDPVETWLRAHAQDTIPDAGFTDQVMSRLALKSPRRPLPQHELILPLAWGVAGSAVILDLLPDGVRRLSEAAYLARTVDPATLIMTTAVAGVLLAGVALWFVLQFPDDHPTKLAL